MKATIRGPAAASLSLLLCSTALAEECVPTTFEGAFDGEVTLCQNWDAEQQQEFWFLSQGSQIIPLRWFLALERVDSEQAFSDGAFLDGFRYIPQRPTARNPFGLPVGFTIDSARGNDEYAELASEWLGLTCAACHTNLIEFDGHRVLIDGAPTLADFEGFMHALVDSMQATLDEPAKFERFAQKVLGEVTEPGRTTLRRHLGAMTAIRHEWNERNRGTSAYGFARLDALGAILNEVAATAADVPGNAQPADAPVSYPFIWDTPHHDRVQWNGSVANEGTGALGRNVGEVLGVFGSISLNTRRIIKDGHETSVVIPNLGRLEELLWSLTSPVWPESILPAIDRDLAERGEGVFRAKCRSCHAEVDRVDPERRIEARLTPLDVLGTDRAMAANFAERTYASGKLKHQPISYFGLNRFGDVAPGVDFLTFAVAGTIFYDFVREPITTLKAVNAGRRDFFVPLNRDLAIAEAALPADLAMPPPAAVAELESARLDQEPVCNADEQFFGLDLDCGVSPAPAPDLERATLGGVTLPVVPERRRVDDSELAYKARPLNGIWATAPYLHNGSVRTLRDLLLPPAERPASFRVGSRTFDPIGVGFVDAGDFVLDTSRPGNSNAGHDYGTGALSETDRDALVEYLKTL